jgi:hypothetical protein
MNKAISRLLVGSLLLIYMESAPATEFEKMGSAIANALGTKKAFQRKLDVAGKETTVFFNKSDSGQPTKLAVVQKAVYEPDCTHTWVIGMNAASRTVDQIRVVEMKCPHAFPTNKANFLDQYKGKGPADMKKLKGEVSTIAKATATSNLTTDAVLRSIAAASLFMKENRSVAGQ